MSKCNVTILSPLYTGKICTVILVILSHIFAGNINNARWIKKRKQFYKLIAKNVNININECLTVYNIYRLFFKQIIERTLLICMAIISTLYWYYIIDVCDND